MDGPVPGAAIHGGERVARALEAAGLAFVDNSVTFIDVAGIRLRLVGLADATSARPDLHLVPQAEEDELSLLLTHDPALFFHVPAGAYLMICGHTHGGQIVPPVLGPVFNASRAPLRWTHGHIEEGGRHLFVSAGFGTSSLPLRLRRPPEVNLLTVTGKKKDPQACGGSRAKWLG